MVSGVKAAIPLPIQIVVDDVGWWSGKNGIAWQEPFRTGIERNHVPTDYQAIIDLGRALNVKPQAAFILCEWDHRPETGEGFALFLRRHESPFPIMQIAMKCIDATAEYEVGFAQTLEIPEKRRMTGHELLNLTIELPNKPDSLIIEYSVVVK